MSTPEQIAQTATGEREEQLASLLYEALADLLDQVQQSPGGHLYLTRLAQQALRTAREEWERQA